MAPRFMKAPANFTELKLAHDILSLHLLCLDTRFYLCVPRAVGQLLVNPFGAIWM